MILNKRRVLLSIVAILILVVAVSGCTSQNDKNSSSYVSPNSTYSTSSTNSSSDNSNSTSTNINSNGRTLSPSVSRPLSPSEGQQLSPSVNRPLSSSVELNSPTVNHFPDIGGIGSGQLMVISSHIITGIEIRISYSGPWSGASAFTYIDENTGTVTSGVNKLSGNGITSIPISGRPKNLNAVIQKKNDNSDILTVEIVENGVVLASNSTSSPYGVTKVEYSF